MEPSRQNGACGILNQKDSERTTVSSTNQEALTAALESPNPFKTKENPSSDSSIYKLVAFVLATLTAVLFGCLVLFGVLLCNKIGLLKCRNKGARLRREEDNMEMENRENERHGNNTYRIFPKYGWGVNYFQMASDQVLN